MNDVAIKLEDVCVDYRPLKDFSFTKNLFHKNYEEGNKIVHAVKNVSLEINKGEIIGIIGKNGSGKSTLLRTIAGIFKPDSGMIDLFENSISLMSIGVGFKDDVSGRRNIVLSGMLLGFSEKEMISKMDSIIDFAEIGDFIDMPVRTYSSGMHSKLAFAITANLDTEIILIDEVLSVGDERFKKKSLNKMKQIITDENRTVVIVSHEMSVLSEYCNRIAWIDDGEIMEVGEPNRIIESYRKYMNS